ncbi:hypothetical protein [Streptomyces humi]
MNPQPRQPYDRPSHGVLQTGRAFPTGPGWGGVGDPAAKVHAPRACGPVDPRAYRPVDPRARGAVDPRTYRAVDPRAYRSVDPRARGAVDPRTYRAVDPRAYRSVDPRACGTGREGVSRAGRPVLSGGHAAG